MSVILRAGRAREAGEAGLRVTAKISSEVGEGEDRRALMRAPPCLPVAPVTRIRVFILKCELRRRMVELRVLEFQSRLSDTEVDCLL